MCKSLLLIASYWFWLILTVIISDFSSKKWIMNHMVLYEIKPIMPFLNLFYTHNYGIVFGFFSGHSNWQRWLFVILTTIITIVVVIIMFLTINEKKSNSISYALIVGGALGNLIDRTCNGFVVDFIDFYLYNWHFATFNIADCSISIGIFIMLLRNVLFLLMERK